MAFKTNEFQQMNLLDNYYSLTERNKKFLKNSWAFGFAEQVFPNIDEERFSVLYSENNASRPNTPINVVIGSLMIKEMFGLTDEELLESILFDVRYQYAIHTTSFSEQPVSDRTFSRFREKVLQYEKETGVDLLKQEMYSLAECYREFLGISHSVKRMDSVMISSNCKVMSRLELFYACVSDMVSLIHRTGADDMLKGFENYLSVEDKNNTIYRCKPEEAQSRLEKVAADAVQLEKFSNKAYGDFSEYQNLKRLLDEQIIINDEQLQLQDSKKIPADSLQNPTDPDASYRFKAGKKHTGYVGNFVETIDKHGSVITQYDYQQNNYADHTFCQEVIDELGEQDEKVTLIADGAYSGMDNVEQADNNNIKLITTALTGPAPSDIHSGFIIDCGTHTVIQCPAGYKPEYFNHNIKRDDYRITFKKEYCKSCPNRDKCKAKLQQKNAVVKLSQNMIDRARYIEHISVREYIVLQKKRNGVEGIPSILRRRYHVDAVPVCGFLPSKLWFSFKIGAINVRKLLKALKEKVDYMKFSKSIIKIKFILKLRVVVDNTSPLLTP